MKSPKTPKIPKASVAAPAADEVTSSVTTLLRRNRSVSNERRNVAATGSGSGYTSTLLGSGIR